MQKKAYSIIFTAFLLICFNTEAQEREINSLEIGAKAPDFDLPGIDGINYSLNDFDDYQVLFVVFWSNHCPTAQAYEDRMIAMVSKYRPKGVGFVAISPNSPVALSLSELGYSDLGVDFDDMVIRATVKAYNFPYLYDGDTHDGSVPYGPVATPHVFIFDHDRLLRYSGRIDDTENPYEESGTSEAKDAIEALLKDREVAVKETPLSGCPIKWKWNDQWSRELEKEWTEMPVTIDTINIKGIKNLITNNSENLRLINLWATWCDPSIREFPELVNIYRMYRGRDFEFISINTDNLSKKNTVLRSLKSHEAANKNYLYSASDKYALIEAVDKNWQGALPHSLLIAPGGEIIRRYAGVINPLTVKQDIVDYLGRYFD